MGAKGWCMANGLTCMSKKGGLPVGSCDGVWINASFCVSVGCGGEGGMV